MTRFILISCIVVCSIFSLLIGVKDISVFNILKLGQEEVMILFVSRIPRIISLIVAGVGMSISGMIMQQITLNKFVSPTTAGSLDAAKLGILIATILLPNTDSLYKMLFAFAFTVIASLIFMRFVNRIKKKSIIFVPLVGIMFGSVLSAISTFFAYKNNIVQNMETWLIGDFSSILKGNYELIYVSLPFVLITYLYANKFTVIGLGEDFSTSLGLNYNRIVALGLVCVSLTVSSIMITAGAIPFLGLIIPNIVSFIFGDNLKKTLPYTAMIGALFLILCDIISRLIIFPYEIPIGLTVGVIGGAIFLLLILKRGRYAT
ncbi:MAG: iron chelate uptake ABC transporter family permease subunit [Psychroflexus sp.]|nr:iron chelate uptake ABC transporter family permease subunit [Psychroflexus sp.]MDN6310325.1 iron chelate uptake ABC transporter family permease subunit [Psychroflexus sp.]